MRSFQACFSEFRFDPCTGLGTEWVQLGLEGSWSGALLCGYGGRHIAQAQLVPGLEGVTENESGATSSQAKRLTIYLKLCWSLRVKWLGSIWLR